LSLSKALRRYISLPIASNQSARLVLGLSGDTYCLPLLKVQKTQIPPSIDNNPILLVGTLRALMWHSLPPPSPPLPLYPIPLSLIDRFQSEPPFPPFTLSPIHTTPPYYPVTLNPNDAFRG
jgi:hypothetical protein